MLRHHARACAAAVFACLPTCAGIVEADVLVANFGGFTPVVRRYSETDGSYLNTSFNFGPEAFADLQLGPDNRAYVAVNGLNLGKIARFDWTTGAYLGDLVPFGQNGYQQPGGFAFGADGNVYAASRDFSGGTSGVLRFNGTSGAFGGVFVAPGSGGLGAPFDVVFMPGGGDMLVSDMQRINRYNKTTGAFISTLIAPGTGGIGNISLTTYGPDGNLYLFDSTHNVIDRFNGATGAFLGTFIGSGDLISRANGMAFGNDGNLYVSQGFNANSEVRRYNGTTGALLGTFIAHDGVNLPDPTGIVFTPEPGVATSSVVCTCAVLIRRTGRARKERRKRSRGYVVT